MRNALHIRLFCDQRDVCYGRDWQVRSGRTTVEAERFDVAKNGTIWVAVRVPRAHIVEGAESYKAITIGGVLLFLWYRSDNRARNCRRAR